MRYVVTMAVMFLCLESLFAQGKANANLQVHEEDGGSVAVRTANGILNQDSSLKRKWYVIDDLNSPVQLDHAGVFPRLDDKENVQYLAPVGVASPRRSISALEVRYLLFDVWGDRLRTLAVTRLTDSSTHIDLRGSDRWPAFDWEVSRLVVVVAFVARVRTAEGQIWTFDADRILPQIEALGLNVAPEDLAPDERRLPNLGLVYWMMLHNRRTQPQ
ncbi:MAG TPA: hypothetical protein VMG31_01465 [Verrucomicrobiae bacterium]|nr:hypothetical protein [Verrucomicrobiae bacterium]